MTLDPRLTAGQDSPPAGRSRGLLVTVAILFVTVIVLVVALVLALGDDGPQDGAAPDESTSAPEAESSPTSPAALSPEETVALLMSQQRRDPDDPYALGDVDADIVIVQYADYRCGYCALWHVEVAPALDPYIESGQVRFEYRDHPVLGDASVYAALAARAAGQQGLFWEYGDALYRDAYDGLDPAYDRSYFLEVAERVGVADLKAFEGALTDSDVLGDIMASRDEALSLNITGTPTFIVHDTLVPGALGTDQFLELVELRLP
ncbi:DsbA family protein [Flaviflexus equikiangi]|uniref:Thioredoxin domain-containing protein n=1 Tax=Flaviflexus equikiangi TaxID=2758573 RepID=A0ABS2TG26_9ACTO|nr:thioredoxin domain-containing protein [Flaviflexus equikiangi]MBM9432209.1 thioredoxin domain-containing protein [Flaviflexus equikiangi]